MRSFKCTALFVFLLAGLALAAPAETGYVILISIDGLAAYHLENQDLLLPNIRALIRQGVWAESSETVFPSITHPSHTTMITGVPPRIHGVIGNRMRDRRTGESFHPTNRLRKEIIAAATIFDAAKERRLTTAAFFWPETKGDASIDYNLPEVFRADSGEPDMQAADHSFLQTLRNGGVPIDFYYRWYRENHLKGATDAILAEAAALVVRSHKPHILTIHLLATDAMQHAHGPEHYLSAAALTNADHCVGVLRQAVKEAGIEDLTTFVIAADHGFHSVRYEVNLYPVFKEHGLADRVTLHPGGWTLYLELKENFDRPKDMAALEEVFRRLGSLEGVSRIVRPEEFHNLGLPRYEESPYVPGQYMIIADINTYLVSNDAGASTERSLKSSPSHSHGYLPNHPRMYPSLVLSGRGIKRGERIGHVSNYDIAPTISHLLDLGMTGLSGRVLKEALLHAK